MASTNSVFTKNSRYTYGGTTELNGKFLEWWNRKTFPIDPSDVFFTLEKRFEGRPDKLASVFYNDSSVWWLILQFNNILDINDEFVAGAILRMPTKARLEKDFLTGKSGGIDSTKIQRTGVSPIVV
jgi:hypothetical protein